MSISVQSGRKRPRRAAPRPPTAVGRRSRASQGALLLCLMLMFLRLALPLLASRGPRIHASISRRPTASAAARRSRGRAAVGRSRSCRRAIGRRHGGRRRKRKFIAAWSFLAAQFFGRRTRTGRAAVHPLTAHREELDERFQGRQGAPPNSMGLTIQVDHRVGGRRSGALRVVLSASCSYVTAWLPRSACSLQAPPMCLALVTSPSSLACT